MAIHYETLYEGSDGVPLVIVHTSPLDMSYIKNSLPSEGFDRPVILIDLPGHGKSDLESENELELASMASAIDTIRTELNLDKISLMGHGIGGFVVQQYAIQFSSHVSSVILVNTSPNAKYRETMGWNIREKFNKVTRQALDQYRGETTEKSLRTRFTQSLATYFDPVNHDAAKELMDNASSIGTEAYVFLAQHVIPKVDFRKALRTVNVPVLVIAGTNDVWPSTSSQLFRNDMLQAEFEEFAGGHFLMIDNTDNFWNKIKEF